MADTAMLRNVSAGRTERVLTRMLLRSRTLWALMAAILGAVLVLAQVGLLVLQAAAPEMGVTLRPADMAPDGGLAVVAPLDASPVFPFRLRSDDSPGDSSLVMYENGRVLGPAHVLHQDIRDLGGGRYSHWGSFVHFSASDGSDPRTNGRRYAATFREEVSPRLVRMLHGADALAASLLLMAVLVPLFRAAASRRDKLATGGLTAVLDVVRLASRHNRWLMLGGGAALVLLLVLSPMLRHLTSLLGGSIGMLFLASWIMARSPGAKIVGISEPATVATRIGFGVRAAAVGAVSLFVLFGPVQFYPAPGWADPSIYHGYFTHYSFNIGFGHPIYQAERLPFVLAGMVFFHSLPVEWAYYAMALLPMVVITLATLSIMGGASPAVAVSVVVLTASNALVIAALGQGYVSGFVLAAMMAGHASLLRSVERDRVTVASFLAGIWFAIAIVTNPTVLIMIQASLLASLLVYPAILIRLPMRILWGGVGVSTVAVVLSLVSKGLTGSYDFISPALNMATASGDTPFAMPLARWLPHCLRLAYVVVVGGCGSITILFCNPSRAARHRGAFLLLCWSLTALMSTAGVLVIADVVLGNAFLLFWYYSCFFVVYTILITGAILALFLPDRGRINRLFIPASCAAGGSCAIVGAIATGETDPASLHPVALAIGIGLLSIACCWLACRDLARSRKVQVTAVFLATVAPLVLLDLNPDTRNAFVFGDGAARDAALVSAEADRFIYNALDEREPYFWYSASDYTRATAHIRGWEFPDHGVYPLWFHTPSLYNVLDQIWCNYYTPTLLSHQDTDDIGHSEPDWKLILREPHRRKAIVVLSHDPDDGRRAASQAAKLFDADLELEAHKVLVHGGVAVNAWVFGLRDPDHRLELSERFR